MPGTKKTVRPAVTAHKRLATYRKKRDFDKTAEPSGAHAAKSSGDGYVIQKHAARRLHYDFRLELDGVLLSWAVPKGPSLAPGARRLAVRTEDHPLDYAGFEGVIPAGEYGGGAVVVWDRGTWTPEGDPRAALAKGHLVFTLAGEKLRGRWHLVKTRGDGKSDSWLLFKSKDDAADPARDIVVERPDSVISGRTVEQVADDADHVWHSNRAEPKAAKKTTRKPMARSSNDEHETAPLAELVRALPLDFTPTNLDKVLYPEQGLTKGAVMAYLALVAEKILPFVADRPLTLLRCPNGTGKPCFFQKHLGDGSPPSVTEIDVGSDQPYMRIEGLSGLLGLAQLGSLEIHTWACRADEVERPDRLVMDLDPDDGLGWDAVVEGALALRKLLKHAGLASFVTTTGGKGVHVVAPLDRQHDWDTHRAFAKGIAELMVETAPDRYVSVASKAARRGKIFVDYLRNGRGATFIAPYSMRARVGATVATPISWDELPDVDASSFTITTVPARLERGVDPWAAFPVTRQSINGTAATKTGTPARGRRSDR